ncbi:hypothetical protein CP532_4710 [Ophiocordyceps camponoti-leonardi (nom. inval.)]|nr:hypothetical protein CP532_4710 [Ophiocordyceps camponoti-leonardi (nom. inval.)]
MVYLKHVLPLLALAAVSAVTAISKRELAGDVLAGIPPYPVKLDGLDWTPQMIASKIEQASSDSSTGSRRHFTNVAVTGSRSKAFDVKEPLLEVDLSKNDGQPGEYRAIISSYTNNLIGIVKQSTENNRVRNTVLLDVNKEKLAGKYLNGGSLDETITLKDGTTISRADLGNHVVNGPRMRSVRRLGKDYIVPMPRSNGGNLMALVFNMNQTEVIRLVKVKSRVPLTSTRDHVVLWTPAPQKTKQATGPGRPTPGQPSTASSSAGAPTTVQQQPSSNSSAGGGSSPRDQQQQACRRPAPASLPCGPVDLPGWVVSLKPGLTDSEAKRHFDWVNKLPVSHGRPGTQGIYKHGRFRGYTGNFTEEAAKQVKSRPEVAIIIRNGLRSVDSGESAQQDDDRHWNIDCLIPPDDPAGPGSRYFSQAGQGTFAYVLDTGINSRHGDFGNRVIDRQCFAPEADCQSPQPRPGKSNFDIDKLTGHGTAVASVIAGTRLGVAKKASIIDVRVHQRYFCSQERKTRSFASESATIEALNWVMADVEARGRQGKSIVNFSQGFDDSYICTQGYQVEDYLTTVYDSGILPVTSAGNDGIPAWHSRKKNAKFMNVGAHDRTLTEAPGSNHGWAVDLLAPGVDIPVADAHNENGGTKLVWGTSLAAPHVAGMALYLMSQGQVNSPQKVMTALLEMASDNVTVLTMNQWGYLSGTAREPQTYRRRLFTDGRYSNKLSEPEQQPPRKKSRTED